jgi:hypothetical protein
MLLSLDCDLVRLGPGPLDLRLDNQFGNLDVKNLPVPGIRPPPCEPGADVEAFEDADPPLGPPALAELPSLRLSLDPVLRGPRLRGFEPAPIVPHENTFFRDRNSVLGLLTQEKIQSTSCLKSLVALIRPHSEAIDNGTMATTRNQFRRTRRPRVSATASR